MADIVIRVERVLRMIEKLDNTAVSNHRRHRSLAKKIIPEVEALLAWYEENDEPSAVAIGESLRAVKARMEPYL